MYDIKKRCQIRILRLSFVFATSSVTVLTIRLSRACPVILFNRIIILFFQKATILKTLTNERGGRGGVNDHLKFPSGFLSFS